MFRTQCFAAANRTAVSAMTVITPVGEGAWPETISMQTAAGQCRSQAGAARNRCRMAGTKHTSSTGTVHRTNWFRLPIRVAMIMPKSVKTALDITVPGRTIWSLTMPCSPAPTPAAAASTAATAREMADRDTTFAAMYSSARTGERASAAGVRWLFSRSTIAPMKNRPIEAGSEKIKMAVAFSRPPSGTADRTAT